ncbi:hypothetical protein [Streptomyces sp. NPDC049879]|uniref:hypothetical protein n=1 Tax=Streptomyces sp. NPDC049879 TaxID=3365598 RepID=UPI003789DFD8
MRQYALVVATAAVVAGAAVFAWRRARPAPGGRCVAYTGDPPPAPFPPPAVINVPTEEALFRRMFPDG